MKKETKDPLQVEMIPRSKIRRDPWQKRNPPSKESVMELAASMREHGVKNPLHVRPDGEGGFYAMDGERRSVAAALAGIEMLPCHVHEGEIDEAFVTLFAMISNVHREQMNPMEFAALCESQMRVRGWTGAEVAAYCQIDPATVSRALALLKLPERIRNDVASGAISGAKAYELSKIGDVELQEKLAHEAANGATRDALAGAVRRASRPKAETSPVTNRVTAKLPNGRAVTIQGVIDGIDSMIEALEELLLKARKARTQGIAVPTFVKMLKDQAG